MLVNFSVSNVFSFKDAQNMSMTASSSQKTTSNISNIFEINDEKYLKSSLIFGANASGKSNFIKAIMLMRELVVGPTQLANNIISQIVPFLLDPNYIQKPSELEVTFYSKNIKYRYGLSIINGVISEEWLYFTPKKRETLLFEREGMKINYNKTNFSEADLFIQNNTIQKTPENIPFITNLSSFNGEHSKNTTVWFSNVNVISGITEGNLMPYSLNLIRNNPDFNLWLKNILRSFQISDINIEETEQDFPFDQIKSNDENLSNLFSSLKNITQKQKSFLFSVIKKINGVEVAFPLEFESDGTRKLIFILGPIYDTMVNGKVLFIDEFDSKFHTLLSKHLFRIFHTQDESNSQIIASVQDTNLMDSEYFNRDQIWFVDKNNSGASELYSLVEYKQKRKSYSEAYLEGAYNAIPLFEDGYNIDEIMNDGK